MLIKIIIIDKNNNKTRRVQIKREKQHIVHKTTTTNE